MAGGNIIPRLWRAKGGAEDAPTLRFRGALQRAGAYVRPMTVDPARDPDSQRLGLALESAGLGEFEWDFAADTFHVSDRMAAITGLDPGAHAAGEGAGFDSHIHPDDRESFERERRGHTQSTGPFQMSFRHIRPDDGRVIWLRVAGVISPGPDGRPAKLTGIVEDITAARAEDERRLQSLAEVDHRVKNVLATVQALAQQTARRTTTLDGFLHAFSGRLKAMASANELLTAARWRGAAIDHLAAAELSPLAPGQTTWSGPELFLTPRAANALSMALHELAANAVRHGALSTDTGHVQLTWRTTPAGGFELTWAETGGPSVAPPERPGFGTTLLEQVTSRELHGDTRIEYLPGGVRTRLRAGPQALAERPDTGPAVAAPRVTETVATSSGPTSLRGARVLIVEDAVLLALELETALSEAGADVVGPAYELEEALGLLGQKIDAAVLDANLNGHSVTPVAEALSRAGTPFVFATGYGDTGGAPGGFDAPVIRKPYDVTQVAAAVADLLGRR